MTRRTRNQLHDVIEEAHCYCIMLEERQIFLHGDYEGEEEMHVQATTANMFLKNMQLLQGKNKSKPIVIHQHSWGGYWDAGMLMYDAIKSCSAPVIMVCSGSAISMGTLVMQAADKRIFTPNCMFMAHYGTTGIAGNTCVAAQSQAAFEKKVMRRQIDIYANACQYGSHWEEYDIEDIKKELDSILRDREDWWMFPEEAVEYGFADGILGDEENPDLETIVESLQQE